MFARRSTHPLFMALACGLILAGRGTVTGMAAAAGIADRWRRACWFFAGAAWDMDDLGLAVARLIVKYLLDEGEPVMVACDGTFFRRWGKHVFQARWAYDGAAQGGKKIAFGNTWVVAAIVVRLPFCPSPVALPVLFRLWRGKGTASQVELAAEMLKCWPGRSPAGRCTGPGTPPSTGSPWPSRAPRGRRGCRQRGAVRAEAAAHRQARPAGGQRRPARHLRRGRAGRGLAGHGHPGLRQGQEVQIAASEALWYGSFKSAPGQLVLIREPGSHKPYDLGLFTLDTSASPAAIAERYSWRWPIEPSNATGKQILGVGDACNRVEKRSSAPSRSGSSSSP